MDLLLAIKEFCDKLIEYGLYPKRKKPSLGKLEKMADQCIKGKFQKLERFIPKETTKEQLAELSLLMDRIKEVVYNETNNE